MNLKTSFFNPAIFRANMKRFWPFGTLFGIIFITFGILPYIQNGTTNSYSSFFAMNFIAMLLSGVMPPILFYFLNNQGAVTYTHNMPIKRSAHFITNILSSYVLIFIPSIICYGICFAISLARKDTSYISILECLGAEFIYVTIISAGATMGVMLTGNTIIALALGVLIAFAPAYTEALIRLFLSSAVFGVWGGDYFCESFFKIVEITKYSLVIFVFALFEYFVAWILYKKRPLETNGDVISFKKIKPIFIAYIGIYFGILGYFYLLSFFNKNILLMLPIGIIGIICSTLLAYKTLKIKKAFKPIILYIIFVLLLFGVIKTDLTGFEKRIPNADDVASVNIDEMQLLGTSHEHSILLEDGTKCYYDISEKEKACTFNKKEDIQNIIELHKYAVKTRQNYGCKQLPIKYTLKNGKTIKRLYGISYYDCEKYLKPIFETSQLRYNKFDIFQGTNKQITSIEILDSRLKRTNNNIFKTIKPNDELSKTIMTALKKDVDSLDLESIFAQTTSDTTISISYRVPLFDTKGKEINTQSIKKNWSLQSNIAITDKFKNTISVLKELGLYDNIYTENDFSKVEFTFDYDQAKKIIITDKAKIKELMNICSSYENVNDTKNKSTALTNIYSIDINFIKGNDVPILMYSLPICNIYDFPIYVFDEAVKYNNSCKQKNNNDEIKVSYSVK